MKYAKNNNISHFLCQVVHIQTSVVSFVKSKIKSFLYKFHDSFLFRCIWNRGIDWLFNYALWHRNIVFHLTTLIQYYYLHIYLQFTLTLWFNFLTNITPPNCIIYCNLCVASRTKVYFASILKLLTFTIFSNGKAFSLSAVNSMLIFLFSLTVVDSADFKMRLFINFGLSFYLIRSSCYLIFYLPLNSLHEKQHLRKNAQRK